ncbi:bifunctional biotin--[acetyl-CoA-carboxylase] ligase/biotin operon repressor BirA [Gilvimarinus sp. SDUM040013]|uniref:Bifunctional ligase/repressor BirA n=1 Tax=Gilvimarinus gilvus TaxID=3058038 RepID=A0ABU4S4T2_9GAMM|nr:bifunctional biotin--[acetyl-CoA-carboxylase] ligase/biotin operon repressor BirA [Gilvimarinus sp. SDUM040013]MDO3385511.1 bifunctional biotin--[acetyl-CoA-carboxylase] ligase/biotin operon repressor BirA [Gilvimarinus sp. SDUM040013]MDX6851411.1 bifunctional biotin--[acetyl-CoA-carboxylase] ligase/biotin operon repressor BirA [Gilvimarinus sp. SDUM040013]
MTDSVMLTLLHLLRDGEFHSGEELGEALAVSRTAVWKQLQKLGELGLECESVRGRGYRLSAPLELLNASRIADLAGVDPTLIQLEVVTDSTNAQLLSRSSTLRSGSFCIAEQQTAGRGRRGRQWISPFGSNLYLSGVWQFEGGAARLEGLSLAVGVCIAQVLESFGFRGVQLKWPNDVLVDGRKLAGILLEMSGDPAGVCQVVVGVGVNVRMPSCAAQSIDQPWTDLASMSSEQGLESVGRNEMVASLVDALSRLMVEFERVGFARWRAAWLERAAFMGQAVSLQTANSEIRGELIGVDGSGALTLRVGGEERLFYGGEVSVRAVS